MSQRGVALPGPNTAVADRPLGNSVGAIGWSAAARWAQSCLNAVGRASRRPFLVANSAPHSGGSARLLCLQGTAGSG